MARAIQQLRNHMALNPDHWTLIKTRAMPCLLNKASVAARAEVAAAITAGKAAAAAARAARDAFETNEDPKKHDALQLAYRDAAVAANAAKAVHDEKKAALQHLNTVEGQLDLLGDNWQLLGDDAAALEAWCEAEEIAVEEAAIATEEALIAQRKIDVAARKA